MDVFLRRGRLAYPSADGTALPSHAEVVVIGGGMTGVLTALMLKRHGVNVVVLEAEEVGSGGTGDCVGAMGLGDGLPLGQIEAAYGTTTAIHYARYMQATADAYEALGETYRLRAQVERRPAILYTQRWEGSLESEAAVTRRLGIPLEIKRRSELPFPILLSLVYPEQAVTDPVMFLYGLARQVPLLAGMRVTEVDGDTCLTDEGDSITAEHIVYACRTPSQKMLEGAPPELLFCHAHALALRDIPPLAGIYTGYDHDGLRMLSRGSHLLLTSAPGVIRREHALGERVRGYYPAARITDVWQPWDTVTADGLPLIGRVADRKYIATGYGGRGLSYAMIAAEMLTAAIHGEEHPLEKLFHPLREMSRVALRKTMARLT